MGCRRRDGAGVPPAESETHTMDDFDRMKVERNVNSAGFTMARITNLLSNETEDAFPKSSLHTASPPSISRRLQYSKYHTVSQGQITLVSTRRIPNTDILTIDF
jgi:hypothetical protein